LGTPWELSHSLCTRMGHLWELSRSLRTKFKMGHPWELSRSLCTKLKNRTPVGTVTFTSYEAQKWDTCGNCHVHFIQSSKMGLCMKYCENSHTLKSSFFSALILVPTSLFLHVLLLCLDITIPTAKKSV
jgi:hypothetical protein